jgi:hypothetical protein
VQTADKLWVDAICINQNDIAERSAQIQRMRNIYSLALCSCAWLGPKGDNSDEAIDMLETMNLALETPSFLQIDGNYSSEFSANYQELIALNHGNGKHYSLSLTGFTGNACGFSKRYRQVLRQHL